MKIPNIIPFFKMKYIAAYMLAKLGGKENPNVEDLKAIIESVGIEFDNKNTEEIVDKLKGKDFNEVMNEGKAKFSVAFNPQTSQTQQQTSKEQKEEEHKEEEETIEFGGGFDDLFN